MEANERERKFEERYGQDLGMQRDHAGDNSGPPRYQTVTANEIKEVYERWPQLSHNILLQIPVIQPGSRLEEGATYFDMAHPERGVFTGMNDMTAGRDNWYVGKSDVDWDIWNEITGVEGQPDRLGRFSRNQAA